MRQCCEVCENFRPTTELEGQKLVELVFGARRVLLCMGHARIAENSRVKTLVDLKKLFGRGRRSFVPRRARIADPIRSDQRANVGRRATDLRAE